MRYEKMGDFVYKQTIGIKKGLCLKGNIRLE